MRPFAAEKFGSSFSVEGVRGSGFFPTSESVDGTADVREYLCKTCDGPPCDRLEGCGGFVVDELGGLSIHRAHAEYGGIDRAHHASPGVSFDFLTAAFASCRNRVIGLVVFRRRASSAAGSFLAPRTWAA